MKGKRLFAIVILASMLMLTLSLSHVYAIESIASYVEDFSSYSEENSVSEATGVYKNQITLGTSSNGAKWISSTVYNGSGDHPDDYKAYMDVINGKMILKSYWNYAVGVNYDWSDANVTIQSLRGLKFKTEYIDGNTSRFAGIKLFVSSDENTYLLFGKANNEFSGIGGVGAAGTVDSTAVTNDAGPRVILVQNNVGTLLNVNDATLGTTYVKAHDTWPFNQNKTLTWTVNINGAGVISWSAVGDNNSASGEINNNNVKAIVKSAYKYPASAYVQGQKEVAFDDIELSVGFEVDRTDLYCGGLGEPTEVLYIDLAENKEDLGDGLYKFNQAAPVRRIVSRQYKNVDFYLSEDGVVYDEFHVDANGNWLNLVNDNNYQYIRMPGIVGNNKLYVFSDLWENDNFVIKKGESRYIYLAQDGMPSASVSWNISDTEFATVNNNGKITGIRDGIVKIKANDTLNTNIKIVGLYTQAVESGDESIMAQYIASQQSIVNAFNIAITTNNKNDVIAFLTGSGSKSLYQMDTISNSEFVAMNNDDLNLFAERLLTYDEFTVSNLDDIKAFEKTLIREKSVNDFLNLTDGEAVGEAIKNNTALELPTNNDYYKAFANDIHNALTNKTFDNYFDLQSKFVETVIVTYARNNINKNSLLSFLDYYESAIGYNKSHYNSITNKNVFADEFIKNKSALTTLTAIKNYVDGYTETASTPITSTVPSSPSGGGNRGGVIASAPMIKVASGQQTVVSKVQLYPDVDVDFWGYDAIRYLQANGAISGYEDGNFLPEKDISRAEFVQMLMSIYGNEIQIEDDEDAIFDDISTSDWYYQSILKAKKMGIIMGNDNKYNPNEAITREEMAAIIYRLSEGNNIVLNTSTTIEMFDDETEISNWAKTAVLKLQASGVISGSDGKFNPHSVATRAMAAQMIFKLFSIE